MKKVLALVLALMMLGCCTFAETRTIDLESMTREELLELKDEIQAEISSRAINTEEGEAYEATRKDPAPIGAKIRTGASEYSADYILDVTITNVIRGDAAWKLMKKLNRWSDKPSSAEEYVVVYMQMDAIDSEDDQQIDISSYDFTFVSDDGLEYGRSVYGVTPEIKSLYAGASNVCAIACIVNKDDQAKLVYNEGYDNAKWFDLNQYASVTIPEDTVFKSLETGSSGDAVVLVQAMLIEMGYLEEPADGNFGAKTQKAIKKYQKDIGLEATGIADEETQKLLLTRTYPDK